MNHLIQFVDLADNSLSQDSLYLVLEGAKKNPNLVSLNISQNELGAGPLSSAFNSLLGMFEPGSLTPETIKSQNLEELILSNNHLTNKHIEQLAGQIKVCPLSSLRKLDISLNTIGVKGILSFFQALRANLQMKISHLNLDRCNLEMGSTQEQVNNFY